LKNSKETDDNEESDKNNNKGKSILNFVAVGDWDCTSETEYTPGKEKGKTQLLQ
jgi:hypothetical protein